MHFATLLLRRTQSLFPHCFSKSPALPFFLLLLLRIVYPFYFFIRFLIAPTGTKKKTFTPWENIKKRQRLECFHQTLGFTLRNYAEEKFFGFQSNSDVLNCRTISMLTYSFFRFFYHLEVFHAPRFRALKSPNPIRNVRCY